MLRDGLLEVVEAIRRAARGDVYFSPAVRKEAFAYLWISTAITGLICCILEMPPGRSVSNSKLRRCEMRKVKWVLLLLLLALLLSDRPGVTLAQEPLPPQVHTADGVQPLGAWRWMYGSRWEFP